MRAGWLVLVAAMAFGCGRVTETDGGKGGAAEQDGGGGTGGEGAADSGASEGVIDGSITASDANSETDAGSAVLDGDAAYECVETDKDVTLQGTIIYDDYASGSIALSVFEDSSTRCTDDPGIVKMMIPGELVGTFALEGPGAFEIMVTVTWVDGQDPPALFMTATQNDEKQGSCDAGGAVWALPIDAEDIEIVMEADFCPTWE